MKYINVLVVDNDTSVLSAFKEHCSAKWSKGKNINDYKVFLYCAETKHEADALIKEHFFHVAIIDLNLVGTDYAGDRILTDLCRLRPFCLRVLLSSIDNTTEEKIARLLYNRIAQLFFDKPTVKYVSIIDEIVEKWLGVNGSSIVNVKYDQSLFENLLERNQNVKSAINITRDEFDCLAASVFGQGRFLTEPKKYGDPNSWGSSFHLDRITDVELHRLGGGLSKAVVARTIPKNQDGLGGILCVVKIGPIDNAEQEFRRYQSYVKFILPVNHRVELLGYTPGDRLGAVCYSFAGDAPEEVSSFQQILKDKDNEIRAFATLDKIFDPSAKTFYAQENESDNQLIEFFRNAYFSDEEDPSTILRTRVRKFIKSLESDKFIQKDRDSDYEWLAGEMKIIIPKLGDGIFAKHFAACIVHGDLNAENIIIGRIKGTTKEKIVLIDYAFTARGPRSLDFATLYTFIKFSRDVATPENLEKIMSIEYQIWHIAWTLPMPSGNLSWGLAEWKENAKEHWSSISEYCNGFSTFDELYKKWPFRAKCCWQVMCLLRSNFPNISSKEFAATSILWCLRLFKIRSLTSSEQIWLLAFMAVCSSDLVKKDS